MAEHAFALIDATFADFRADDLRVKPAEHPWERRGYYRLRHAVFTAEQALLSQDRDAHDFTAVPIVAVAHHCGMPEDVVGAVRIYSPEPGLWYGGRLCVAPAYRRHGLIGTALVNEAVARAKDLGCERFLATVQQHNEGYFHGLHWHNLDTLDLHGQPHCLMQAELSRYPFMPRQVSLIPFKGRHHG
ncbi:MSMEG_0567/Sll0786 family nitrogen starvation N-acetyltransferase [Pseudomonas typographi]|uniref:MSMEG_0567/Sll0786 family nitrogen starvation N-acetyltransferase n=1 Tax=Pseudomonas typographi TaxID=2715964 RepID=UPI001688A4BF|nr:MSMEG_0567/Sll0786 family nitrogen starvation N-acetyltransferase [Pseudomonas typographi]MBD1552707.1 GNAT family N-acetyltransferase [Pseudomonas typographi]